jgi:hypothetical protein
MCTTGNEYFAECQKHSAKLQKHSAKALPSVALGKGHTEERLSAKGTLPSAFRRALGKAFAERKVPRSANFERRDGTGHNGRFAECQDLALGKDFFFAECREHDTRQRFFRFCRVLHSAK